MKQQFQFLSIIFLFFLFLFSSCGDNNIAVEEPKDYTELILELEQDPDFQEYITNRITFFNDLENHRLNLIGVSHLVGEFNSADFCHLKDHYVGQLEKDVRGFSKFYCTENSLLIQLLQKYPDFLKITNEINLKFFNH